MKSKMIRAIPGAEVKAMRTKLNMSQGAFAKRFSVAQSTMHAWERLGVPAGPTAIAYQMIADLLLREATSPRRRRRAKAA